MKNKGICNTCYYKTKPKRKCKKCKIVKRIKALGLCGNCYQKVKGYRYHRTGKQTQLKHRKIALKNIKLKCYFCDEKRVTMLDVHHKDKNYKNNSVDNLVWLCPNHHREVHRGYKELPKQSPPR